MQSQTRCYKEQGKVLGRPVKVANIKKLIEDRNSGKTIRELAKQHSISIGKVHKLLKNL